jgi:hypothetical protein
VTNIRRYIERAAKAGDVQHETLVIASPEEAIQASREIAAEIAGLPDDARLALLSDLHELNHALERRLPRLDRELSQVRDQLRVVRDGVRAANRYAQGADLARPTRPRRRP